MRLSLGLSSTLAPSLSVSRTLARPRAPHSLHDISNMLGRHVSGELRSLFGHFCGVFSHLRVRNPAEAGAEPHEGRAGPAEVPLKRLVGVSFAGAVTEMLVLVLVLAEVVLMSRWSILAELPHPSASSPAPTPPSPATAPSATAPEPAGTIVGEIRCSSHAEFESNLL